MTDLAQSSALRGQIEFYDRQAESWMPDHLAASACFDLQTLLSVGLNLYGLINKITERFNDGSARRNVGFDEVTARMISELYRLWYKPCENILRVIERFEQNGYIVDHAEKFRHACREARIPAFEFNRITSAMNQFSRGEGRPMGEAMLELRNPTLE